MQTGSQCLDDGEIICQFSRLGHVTSYGRDVRECRLEVSAWMMGKLGHVNSYSRDVRERRLEVNAWTRGTW